MLFRSDLAPSLAPWVGVLLNLTPDHIDRHGTMENYAAVKERLVAKSRCAVIGVDDDACRAIRARLEQAFAPEQLEIVDDSHRHAGHEGAKDGRGHFRVRIVSQRFAGTRNLDRHRMVYAALGSLMRTDIHALSVDAQVPEQREQR